MGTDYIDSHSDNDISRKDEVYVIASNILTRENKTSFGNSLTSTEIYEKYKSNCKEQGIENLIPLNTFQYYLSKLSKSDNSQICRDTSRYGYIFSENSFIDENINSYSQTLKINGNDILEKELYLPLKEWLEIKCKFSIDISNQKGNGKWGNPDILGLNFIDLYGVHLQLTTIEAKRDVAKWRTDFFEAVAHTLFSHYSYYAFLCESTFKVPELMKHYAMTFGVGILAVRLQKGSESTSSSERFLIEEIVPATIHNPEIRLVKDFLDSQLEVINMGYISINKK